MTFNEGEDWSAIVIRIKRAKEYVFPGGTKKINAVTRRRANAMEMPLNLSGIYRGIGVIVD
jgi:hypothetical protein